MTTPKPLTEALQDLLGEWAQDGVHKAPASRELKAVVDRYTSAEVKRDVGAVNEDGDLAWLPPEGDSPRVREAKVLDVLDRERDLSLGERVFETTTTGWVKVQK